jgi:hypothetical protein
MRRLRSHAVIDSLEPRLFLDAAAPFEANINFQLAGAPVPAGYVADTGAVFGNRGNGLTYGWNADNTAFARDRDAHVAPDQARDTLLHMDRPGSASVWEIAVPNGVYDVHLVAGDPSYWDSVYRINVEGVLGVSGNPSSAARWFEGSVRVSVSDGRLTLSNAAGSSNNKINLIQIRQVTDAQPPANAQTPFGGVPIGLPAQIEAENFDNGGPGVAYSDLNAENRGGAYRDTGVDIKAGGSGYFVGFTHPGEWMEYTIDVPRAGTYLLELRVAGLYNSAFRVEFNGIDKTGVINISPTGGWTNFQTFSRTVTLSAGRQVMRLYCVSGLNESAGNIDWIRLTPQSPQTPIEVTWMRTQDAPIARCETAKAVVGNRVYLFGGLVDNSYVATTRCDYYDVTTNRWYRIADLPRAVTHMGTAVDGQYVYLAGGFVTPMNDVATNEVWRYDTVNNRFEAFVPLPAARAAGGLVGRNLHYIGGTINHYAADMRDHWVLNLDNPQAGWSSLAPLPTGRNHLGYTVLNNQIYIIGGQKLRDENNGNIGVVERYDPATNTWTRLPDIPAPRGHIGEATFVMNGKVVVAGGVTNYYTKLDLLTAYDPLTNTWTELTTLPSPRLSAVAAFVNGRLIYGAGLSWRFEPTMFISNPL